MNLERKTKHSQEPLMDSLVSGAKPAKNKPSVSWGAGRGAARRPLPSK